MERDQNNHVDNVHDEKVDHKMGRDFRNLGPHAGMVHLHSGIEHLNNVDVEVGYSFISTSGTLTFNVIKFIHFIYFTFGCFSGKAGKRRSWLLRFRAIVRIMRCLWG